MPSVEFSDSYRIQIFGYPTNYVRVDYTEVEYDTTSKKTKVRLDGVYIKYTGATATSRCFGTLKFNGTTMLTMDGSPYQLNVSESYTLVPNTNNGATVWIQHNDAGAATLAIALSGGTRNDDNDDVFGALYYYGSGYPVIGVRTPASKNVSLTTHTPTYTVAYNANGGSGAPSSQTKAYGTTLTLSSTKPTRSSISASPAKYTVTFNANNGTVSPASKDAARTTSYTFSKWNTKSDGSGTSYSPGGSYSANAAATLYAQWSSSTSTAAITLPTPTREGYSFNGWYTAATGGTKVGAGGASYTPSSNITIYAQWAGLASTIASKTSSVATQGTFTLSVSRKSSAYYHKVTFKIGSTTLEPSSSAFATTLNYTVPRTWFNNYGSQTSLTVTASVQTYTTSACTTEVGSPATTSFTVTADSGMKPVVSSGWVTFAPYNTGATASISGYVKGYSKAQATFNSAKISMSNAAGATISSYSITCQGTTDSSSPYQTPVLTSTSVSVTCTVTDSRGRTASETFTLSVYDYSKPSLSGISVFRCTGTGTASEDGTNYSAKATSTFSSLNGQNTCTIKVSHAQSGGSYGTEYTLTSGTARVIGSLSVDKSYTVRIIATDSLGNSATYTASIPTKTWAMKFRPNGQGVAFGKAAEHDKTFEIADDWYLRYSNYIPLNNVVNKIPSGADLNDYDLPGVYAIGSSSTAETIANIPVQSAGTVRVFSSAGAAITASSTWKYLIQEYIAYTGERYQRYGESGSGTAVTWRAWVTIYTSANFENPPIRYVDKSGISVTISSNGGYQSLGTFTSLGVPTGATVVSFFIKGWSGANGAPVLLASSDGTTLYCMMSDAPSSVTINIRIFYEL